jgi:hypothetical protein
MSDPAPDQQDPAPATYPAPEPAPEPQPEELPEKVRERAQQRAEHERSELLAKKPKHTARPRTGDQR